MVRAGQLHDFVEGCIADGTKPTLDTHSRVLNVSKQFYVLVHGVSKEKQEKPDQNTLYQWQMLE